MELHDPKLQHINLDNIARGGDNVKIRNFPLIKGIVKDRKSNTL
jgi:hypothetical protein